MRASGGRAALAANESVHPAVILLDIAMPDLDGIEVLAHLRAAGDDVPVCVLSARDEVDDRVRGLQAGADDYVVKPFAIEEVTARLHALLRRRPAMPDAALSVGDVTIDPRSHAATRAGRDLELTRREFDLLHLFMRRPGEVVDRASCTRRCGATRSIRARTSPTSSSATCAASSRPAASRASCTPCAASGSSCEPERMRSLRGRLTLGITLVLAVVLAGAGVIVSRDAERSERAALDDYLKRTAELSRETSATALRRGDPAAGRRG